MPPPSRGQRTLAATAAAFAAGAIWLLAGGGEHSDRGAHPAPESALTQPAAAHPAGPRPAGTPPVGASPSAAAYASGPNGDGPSAVRTPGPPCALSNQDLQQMLEDSLPDSNVPPAVSRPAVEAAWRALTQDLAAGRWKNLQMQAGHAQAPGGGDSEGPTVLDVTLMWAGANPLGRHVGLNRNEVRLSRTPGGAWALMRISRASR